MVVVEGTHIAILLYSTINAVSLRLVFDRTPAPCICVFSPLSLSLRWPRSLAALLYEYTELSFSISSGHNFGWFAGFSLPLSCTLLVALIAWAGSLSAVTGAAAADLPSTAEQVTLYSVACRLISYYCHVSSTQS